MNVFITGGTGFIGRALVLRLRRDGHEVTAYVRNVDRARSLLGTEAHLVHSGAGDDALQTALSHADAVINLAGEPVLGGRWTEGKKKAIRDSRVSGTRDIVEAIAAVQNKPKVLVSASAVGAYGDGGDRILTEESERGNDFLAEVCHAWEDEANRAKDAGLRVALFRIGVVLGRAGGALEPMLPLFRLGLGGPIGSGNQYVSWIHLEDLVEMMATAISDVRYDGIYNATGPEPVTFRQFASTIGSRLKRPAVLPAPSLAIKAVFGEGSDVLLNGQRAIPAAAKKLGFEHRFETVDDALRDLLDDGGVTIEPIDGPIPNTAYLRHRKPTYVLRARAVFNRPINEILPFFSRPENLGLITPAGMRFRITRMPEEIIEGSEIDYRLKIGPVPLKWRTRIDVWIEGERFVDSQMKGPYASWWHEHVFEADGNRTIMTDRVFYAPPMGPLGRIANAVFIAGQLKQVFGYRTSVMRLRFGADSSN